MGLLAFIGIREVLFLRERKGFLSSSKDLLDRLMAFNQEAFDRFSYAKIAEKEVERGPEEKSPWEPDEYDPIQTPPDGYTGDIP